MHLNGTQWVARFRFAAFPLDNSSARSDCDGDDDGGLTTALLKARVDWHAWHAHAQPKVTRRHERGKASAHFLSVYRQRLLLGYFCCCMQLASISGAFIKSQRHKERVTATVFTLDTTWRCSVPPRLEAACTAFLPLRLKRNSCQGGGRVLCRAQACWVSVWVCLLPATARRRHRPLYALHVAKLHLEATVFFSFFTAIAVVVVVLAVLHVLLLYFIFLFFLYFRFRYCDEKLLKWHKLPVGDTFRW